MVEALELFVDNVRKAILVDEGLRAPHGQFGSTLRFARRLNRKTARGPRGAPRGSDVTKPATEDGARDAARLLGPSHHRAHQLTQEDASR
jgi:hypothetical protein